MEERKEEQLELLTKKGKKDKRGGKRPGAGRPPTGVDTKVIRVPERYHEAIKALIDHLEANRDLDSHDLEQAKTVFLRSLHEKKQNITFVLKGI